MRTCNRINAVVGVSAAGLVLLVLGCDPEPPTRQTTAPQKTAEPDAKSPPTRPAAAATTAAADLKEPAAGSGDAKKVSIWQQRVVGSARQAATGAHQRLRLPREGQPRAVDVRRGTKEHEAILAADCDARDIATGLLATGAKAGTPVKYSEDGKETIPPTGQRTR